MSARLGVVVAMENEARAFTILKENSFVKIFQAGIGPNQAAEATRKLLTQGCSTLISAGLCGGLALNLAPGTLVLADRVIDQKYHVFKTDINHRVNLRRTFQKTISFTEGVLISCTQTVRTPKCKAELYKRFGAIAVDMESYAIAQVAAKAHVPFLALRVIADTATDELPLAALAGITTTGEYNASGVLLKLLKQPSDLLKLFRLWQHTNIALGTLRQIAALMANTDLCLLHHETDYV